jgi:arylsulfatase A-like enzyme
MKRFVCALAGVLAIAVANPSGIGYRISDIGSRVSDTDSRPSLVVIIVVDQMRADYLTRYAPLFQHGLKRLTSEGAWYQDAAYPYMSTFTCVGHTTIATGTLPYKHGIIDNQWYDRERQKTVTCTEDPNATEVSYGSVTGVGDSAHNMFQPSLAELMRRNTNARVATMSLKARSAIGLAGHSADSVTWFDERGAWETSTAFAQAPLPWLSKFITAHPIDADAGKDWERSLPADRYSGPDDAAGERGPGGWGRTFPHPLGAAGDRNFHMHWEDSPFSDEYLERMAEATVDALELGQRKGAPADFLGISFSALDLVGHAYGPSSHEVQDLLVRLDATIGRLLDALDTKIGKGKYVLALSADHGVAEVPEQVKAGGGRIDAKAITQAVDGALKGELGNGPFVATTVGPDLYFKPELADKIKSAPGAIDKAVAAISGMQGVARVFRGTDLDTPAARRSKDPEVRAAALSYFRSRSGDLIVLPKENWDITGSATSHGTLYGYDQHVPVVLFGGGVHAGVHHETATPADIAPTLASRINVKLPSTDGHILRSK